MRTTPIVAALLLLAASLLIPLASLEAQLPLGQRVRITAAQLGISKYSGTLIAVHGDTLTVDTLAVALTNLTRLGVYMGRKGHAVTGAVVGGLVVVVPLAILVALCGDSFGFPSGGEAVEGLFFWGAAGAFVGVLIGAATRTDRWEEIPLDQLRVSFGPQRDGRFGFGASVRF